MAATDTDSIHDNMTRLRMRMVQQKLANERDRLHHGPTSASSSDDNVDQLKIQQAMLRRQELLDRIRFESIRPKSQTERRRYTPTPLPPPSRHSLPDLHRHYHCNYVTKQKHHGGPGCGPPPPGSAPGPTRPHPEDGENGSGYISNPEAEMSQIKHVIEHKFKQPETQVQHYSLPPIATPPPIIQQPTIIQPPIIQPSVITPQYTTIQSPPIVATAMPQFQTLDWMGPRVVEKEKGSLFNKSEFMDMMMMQNAQMHHMAMQQMMVKNLNPPQQPMMSPVVPAAPPYPRPVYHHHYGAMAAPAAPAMYHHTAMPGASYPSYDNIRGSRGHRGESTDIYKNPNMTIDDGSNYYVYH